MLTKHKWPSMLLLLFFCFFFEMGPSMHFTLTKTWLCLFVSIIHTRGFACSREHKRASLGEWPEAACLIRMGWWSRAQCDCMERRPAVRAAACSPRWNQQHLAFFLWVVAGLTKKDKPAISTDGPRHWDTTSERAGTRECRKESDLPALEGGVVKQDLPLSVQGMPKFSQKEKYSDGTARIQFVLSFFSFQKKREGKKTGAKSAGIPISTGENIYSPEPRAKKSSHVCIYIPQRGGIKVTGARAY